MTRVAAALIFIGILLMFGAVGGMEAVAVWEPNPWYWHQVVIAIVGLVTMGLGACLLPKEQRHD